MNFYLELVKELFIIPTLTPSKFEEETAGFMSHPASSLNSDEIKSELQVMIENMGMSDPECSQINGRTFTASALRNLIPENK